MPVIPRFIDEPRDWARPWVDPPGLLPKGKCCCSSGTCNFRAIDSSGALQWTFLASRAHALNIGVDAGNSYAYTWSADSFVQFSGNATIEKFDFATQTVAWSRALTSLNPPTDTTNRLDYGHFAVVPSDGRYYYANGTTAISYVIRAADLSNGAIWTSSIQPLTIFSTKAGDFLYTHSSASGPYRINGSTGAAIWQKFTASQSAGGVDTSDRFVGVRLDNITQIFVFYTVAAGATSTQTITGSSIRQQTVAALNLTTNKMTVAGKDSGGTTAYLNQIPLTGTADWEASISTSDNVQSTANDPSGNSYIALGTRVRKYDSSGAFQWEYDHGATVYRILTDSSDNLYLGGAEAAI
jgi:hypothetical protein